MKPTDREMAKSGLTRRALIKDLAIGTVALAGMGSLTGCASGEESASPQAQNESASAGTAGRATSTYEADVVVVGGGVAGMFAARSVLKGGKTVAIVDKGPFGHSGASGINWGHALSGYESLDDVESPDLWGLVATGTEGLVDQDYYAAQVEWSMRENIHAIWQKYGVLWDRGSSGEVAATAVEGYCVEDRVNAMPHMMAQHIRRSGAKVIDRTMVLDILLDAQGEAAGVVGIDLVTGDAVIVRAKAVIMCMGSPIWCNGWSGISAKTNGGPECTGDGYAIGLSHGVAFKNMEQWALYFYNLHPTSISYSNNIGFSCYDHPENVLNGNGEQVIGPDCEPWNAFPQVSTYNKIVMSEIYEGRASENGGILYDITDLDQPEVFMAFNRRNLDSQQRDLGYTPENPSELAPVPWEHGGGPKLTREGETTIPGLYWSTAQEGAYDALAGWNCCAGGAIAGEAAAKRSASMELQAVDFTAADAVLEEAYMMLERDGDGKSADEVAHAIQEVCHTYLFGGRDEEGLTSAIEELTRILEEDVPAMVVADKSPRLNMEWRHAMEAPKMAMCCLAIAQASLFRTETRGFHHRLDYPAMDNENWLKNVWVSYEDGAWATEATDIVDSHLSADEIREMVPEIGVCDELHL